MAQRKYDLVTVPTVKTSPVKAQPWYKERLELKFSKSCGLRTSLRGRSWIFIRGDVDDWRNGTPSLEKLIIRNKTDLLPVVSSETLGRSPQIKRKKIVHNGKTATLFTNEGAQQQMAKRRIRNVELSLTSHPLALYPHLEKSIPIEMFDDVVELLDPDMKPTGSEIEMATPPDSPVRINTGLDDDASKFNSSNDDEAATQQDIYRLPMVGIAEEPSNADHAADAKSSSSAVSKVEQVTKDLCRWMKNLNVEGGPSMDEERIQELFTNDYETNRNWSVPVRVVELTTIPLELRGVSAQYSRSVSAQSHRLHSANSFMLPKSLEELPQRCVRTKYGAWYLPRSLWKPMFWNEELRDPKEVAKEADSEIKTNFLHDTDLADTHAARTFKEYIKKKEIERGPNANTRRKSYLRSSSRAGQPTIT